MSTQLLLLYFTTPPHFTNHRRSSPAAAPSRWHSHAHPIPKGRRSSFDLDDDDRDDYDGGFVFREGSTRKKRVWWSDVDGGEVEEEEEVEEFWGFQLLAAFGWMVPAVGISLLLGTGPNAFIMALVVPLGQRLISLAFKKAVGMVSDASRPRYRPTKTKRKPYPRAKAETRKPNGNERRESRSGGERNGYRSWAAADASYSSVGGKGKSRYGGWDDLDDKPRTSKAGGGVPPQRDDGGPYRQQRKSKSRSRVGRSKETPLLMRLLIAALPFLGFWTRLF